MMKSCLAQQGPLALPLAHVCSNRVVQQPVQVLLGYRMLGMVVFSRVQSRTRVEAVRGRVAAASAEIRGVKKGTACLGVWGWVTWWVGKHVDCTGLAVNRACAWVLML